MASMEASDHKRRLLGETKSRHTEAEEETPTKASVPYRTSLYSFLEAWPHVMLIPSQELRVKFRSDNCLRSFLQWPDYVI